MILCTATLGQSRISVAMNEPVSAERGLVIFITITAHKSIIAG